MSAPLIRIAIASIALGVIVMVMSVCILRGFQKEITRKVVGFGSHIVVRSLSAGENFEETPIDITRQDIQRLPEIKGIRHMQFFANKGGMAKTDDQIHGIIFKGISKEFDTAFFAENLTAGRLFAHGDSSASLEVVISQTIANKLKLTVGDKLRTYFWQGNNYRARAFSIVGIYNTDLTEFDEHFVVGDLAQVQKLNGWESDQAGGCELLVEDFGQLDAATQQVMQSIGYDLTCYTVVQQNPALFSWLELLNSNITLIIIIMSFVCIVAIVSALLIMIFEKASAIGLLKVLGATNRLIRSVFIVKSVEIIGIGLAIGNAVSLLLCWLQSRFEIVKLDSESYSMTHVPIDMNAWIFILISAAALIACLLSLLLPASYISRIQPAKSLRFE